MFDHFEIKTGTEVVSPSQGAGPGQDCRLVDYEAAAAPALDTVVRHWRPGIPGSAIRVEHPRRSSRPRRSAPPPPVRSELRALEC